jgi:type VI secretion system protein ImpJ
MRQLEPVVWTKGTFLSPQHLQNQDRFLKDSLQFHLESLAFRPWGFVSLEVSHAELASGMFGVTRASGIFPDGLLFDVPGSDHAPPLKPLADCFAQDRHTVELYLAVPQFHKRGLNVASREGDARYRIEMEVVPDENTGLSERPIQVARKNLRLLTEDDPREGYTTLLVARVRRTDTGLFQMDPHFVPPLVDFSASDYLMSAARRMVEILSARSASLSGMRRQRNQSLADFTSADIANFWLLYTINTALPVFRHLYETRRGHPEGLFAAMLMLAGELTTFSPDIHPRDLPAYEHDQLGECFGALDEKLRILLDTVVPANFVALPLKPVQTAIYATSIDHDKYLVNTKMYLAVSAEAPQAEIIARTPQLVKVCSANQIEHLVRQALPGVTLTYVGSPPSALQVKLNYQYFSLSQGGPAWEAVLRSRNLAAYVPADLPGAQLELLILLPQPNGGNRDQA